MAADGSHAPKPWKQRKASTVFLRVPAADWPAVRRGIKREFRAASGAASGLHFVKTPTLVVGYTVKRGKYDSRLMVLERRWTEPLGSITQESLEAEGFRNLAEWRRYWMQRERRRFTPTRNVTAYRVRPATPDDREVFAEKLLEHLFGEWL